MSASSTTDAMLSAVRRERRVVMVVDVVESVRLMEVCEGDFIERWRRFVHELRTEVLPGRGEMVKSLGDGVLLCFDRVPEAIEAAFDLHRRALRINGDRVPAHRMHLRAGAHIADVMFDGNDVYGIGVNLAARLAGLANPDTVVISSEVRDELVDGLHARLVDLGDCWFKHIDRPVRAFRAEPVETTPWMVPADRRDAVDEQVRGGIAVIPFSIRGGDPAHAAIGDALADDLIGTLSQWRGWRVLSRLSTAHFRGGSLGIAEVRRHLQAAYVVWGSLSVQGGRVRAYPELVDTADGSVLWSGNVEFEVEDLFAGQSDAVDDLVEAISRSLVDHALRRARALPMPSLSTYSLYLGATAMLHRLTDADFLGARALLEHLAERVPRSPAPHAMLAKWHVLQAMQGQRAAVHQAEVARAEARRAIQIDPADAFGLAVEGLVAIHVDNDFERAGDCLREALRCNPQEPYAWCFQSGLHSYLGQGEAAERDAQRALDLSPLDPTRYHLDAYAANAKLSVGKYAEAAALARGSVALNSLHLPSYRILAIAQMLAGDGDGARESVRRMLALEPSFTVRSYLQRYPGRDSAAAAAYVAALRESGVPD